MYYALGAFVKPSFGTAGSEARATGERFSVKYSLILLSALLVVACGGLTKEQQAMTYSAIADKYNTAIDQAEAVYEAAIDVATTDDDGLLAITELYSTYAGIDRIFADELAESAWSSEFEVQVGNLIDCTNEVYLLEIDVALATELQEAIDLSDVADEKMGACGLIVDGLRSSLGLPPAPQ
jgi:hypothetical protein